MTTDRPLAQVVEAKPRTASPWLLRIRREHWQDEGWWGLAWHCSAERREQVLTGYPPKEER